MRISYRKKPELDSFDNDFKPLRYLKEEDSYLVSSKIKSLFLDFKNESGFKKRIITKPILQYSGGSNSVKLIRDILPKLKEYRHKGIFFINNTTYFFKIWDNKVKFIIFQNGVVASALDDSTGLSYIGKYFLDHFETSKEQHHMDQLQLILSISLFIEYAQIETKILEPNKKDKLFACKYFNETFSDIEIINSTWFTNLVKSDAFKVRGHFRLQPKKKDGEWTKELIWINDFEKSGYTATARKAAIEKANEIYNGTNR